MRLLLILSFLIISEASFCQVNLYSKAGVNYSNLGEIDYPPVQIDSDMTLNLNIGSGVKFKINEALSFHGEMLWNVKGGKNTFHYTSEPVLTRIYRYSYLSLPIFIKFKVKKIGFFVGFEPSYFVLGSIQDLGGFDRTPLKYSPSRPYKNHDYGILGGISYSINKNFFLDLRYVHGSVITYIYVPHIVNGVVFDKGVEHNRMFSLSLGYHFLRGKKN